MHRSSRLSAAVLATALVGTLTPAVTAFGTPASAHATVAADRGTADVRIFQDRDHDKQYDDGEPPLQPTYLNKTLTLKNKATGKWYVIHPGNLKKFGLPAGDYTLYVEMNSTFGHYAIVDTATGKRLPDTMLKMNVPATRIGDKGQEITNGVTAGYGRHSYTDITLVAGKPLDLSYAASSIGANVSAVETKDGAEVAAPDAVGVAFKDGSASVKSSNVDGLYWAGKGDAAWDKHLFASGKVTARISPKINYAVDKVEARFHQQEDGAYNIDKLSDPLKVTSDPANHTYTVNSSDSGEAWGNFEYKAFLKPVEIGKATVRLFGDENVDNKYSGPEEKVSESYINLVDSNGLWFKVEPESLEKQGLPAGEYTAYVRNASVADGFGVVVDSATGKRMETVSLDESHDATYVDADTGETLPTVTDKGRFVKTTFTVAPDKETVVDMASTRIDASAKVTVDGEAADSKVYFKDGETRLESFVSKTSTTTEHLASDDADKKTRHFFSEEWVTVGVEGIDGHNVKGVTVGGLAGGKTVDAEKVSDTEYRVKRSVLGDDFGRLKFDVQLEKVAPTGKVNFRLFGDENLNNSFDEGTDKLESRYVNLVDEEGNWYKVMPDALAQQGLPAGKYTVYMRDASVADGFGVVVDSDGKRLPFAELKGKKDATFIDAKTGEKAETTTDEGRFVTTEIEIKENETIEANFASTRIDATAKVTADGEAVDSKVYFKDGDQRLETYKSDSVGYVASDDAGAKTRHFFSEEWVTVGVEEIDGYTVKGVTVRGFGGGKTVEAEKVSDTEYRIKRSEMGDDFGRFEFDVQLEKVAPTGKVDFRLFRDENLDNKYSGDAEEVASGYVNLVDEQGNWYKVTPDSLAKQGLPAGKYTVYMRNNSVADGFGVFVDSEGKRLPFAELEGGEKATYIDADTGKKIETTTDRGRFVTTEIEVKENETVEANFAFTRIDGSAQVNKDEVESVYFKDGDQRLEAFEFESGGFMASDDAEAKKRHFFSGDKVTLGVNVKEGRKVTKVEVKPSATRGGETIVLFDEETAGDNAGVQEFSVDRSKMGDDFGRFEFVVTTAPVEEPTPEPTDDPTEEPTPEPTDDPTEEPTPEPTDDPTEEPTPEPTEDPTEEPTPEPTDDPTEEPTPEPTDDPTVAPEPNGKVDFRLFRDESLDNEYSGENEDVASSYVYLVDEQGNWYKVTPEALEKQGLPEGKYTVYMQNDSVAKGFGVVVDSEGKRLPFAELKGGEKATEIDPDTGEKSEATTEGGNFVETEIEVKENKTTEAHFAFTRIDASVQVNKDEVESVYFKDGGQRLEAHESESGGYVAYDTKAKKQHFFSDDKVTLGVNVKEGRKVTKVEVKPSSNDGETIVLFDEATAGNNAGVAPVAPGAALSMGVAAQVRVAAVNAGIVPVSNVVASAGAQEFSVDRKAMGTGVGSFEFVVTTAPVEEPTDEPSEEPTEEPSEEPTDAPSEEPSEEPTDAPSEGGDDETPGDDGEPGDGDNGEGDTSDNADSDNTGSGEEGNDNKGNDSSKDNGALPRTGVNVGVSLAVGVALVALGAGLVFRRRKN